MRNQRDRGSSVIAFVAPEFPAPGLKQVFSGFGKIVGLSLHFCGSIEQAVTLLAGAET